MNQIQPFNLELTSLVKWRTKMEHFGNFNNLDHANPSD